MIDPTMHDRIEGMIAAAVLEVLVALDGGAAGDYLDDGVNYIGHFLFVEVATLSRSVDAAEAAVQRFADKVASIAFCEKCKKHRVGGKCIACVLEADLAWIKEQAGEHA